MAGQTFGTKIERDLGGDIETQKGFLRTYCADNPPRLFVEAVIDLYAKRKRLP
jgi:hypothetical protein